MNLLEATSTLIDAAKTYGPESDRVLQRSIKRMEKRLHVLQVRSAKARKRNRMKAFWDAMAIFSGGVTDTTRQVGGIWPTTTKFPNTAKLEAVIPCRACCHAIRFGEFCKGAEFNGRGEILTLTCQACACVMESPRL